MQDVFFKADLQPYLNVLPRKGSAIQGPVAKENGGVKLRVQKSCALRSHLMLSQWK